MVVINLPFVSFVLGPALIFQQSCTDFEINYYDVIFFDYHYLLLIINQGGKYFKMYLFQL